MTALRKATIDMAIANAMWFFFKNKGVQTMLTMALCPLLRWIKKVLEPTRILVMKRLR